MSSNLKKTQYKQKSPKKLYLEFISLVELIRFILDVKSKVSLSKRIYIVKQMIVISSKVDCPHTQSEVLSFIKTVLALPRDVKGCIVEAGSYKGGSTAKFSIAANIANRQLIVFDSFEGIPEDSNPKDKNFYGKSAYFKKGSYKGTIEEVKKNVSKYGEISACRFIKGDFKKTMPKFSKLIASIYLDVDLASSTKICLKYLYPKLNNNGTLFSQDGHIIPVIKVFEDNIFWKEIGCKKPLVENLGKNKLIKITKRLEKKK